MKIHVTRDDIRNGIPSRAAKCPIALAVNRTMGGVCRVTDKEVCTADGHYKLPWLARIFVFLYDHGVPVIPFSFKVNIDEN